MSHRFSSRTGWDVSEDTLAAAIRQARAGGRELIDLTISNPTACGFEYDAETLLSPLSDPRALAYDPDPRGMFSAREAVSGYYNFHEAEVAPNDLILTTSTSEGYSFLFRLLADAGDEVLVAQPSYPLFDFLADLDDVKLRPHPLFYDHGWWIDFAELERRIGPRTRAIVVVHPNNPTGHTTKPEERARLEALCQRHGLALIVDEVFLDYSLEEIEEENGEGAGGIESFARGPHPALTFVLSGMSKIAGLPQMKVAWIATLGPEEARRQALARLEVIADTFLSMNAPVQLALPVWLDERGAIQAQILDRTRRNLAFIRRSGLESLRTEAGWCAILRLPRTVARTVLQSGSADLALDLLQRAAVIVHPGTFYGIAETGRVVVSLLCPEENFAEGICRIAAAISEPD